jgi:hypothetical protein
VASQRFTFTQGFHQAPIATHAVHRLDAASVQTRFQRANRAACAINAHIMPTAIVPDGLNAYFLNMRFRLSIQGVFTSDRNRQPDEKCRMVLNCRAT